MTRNYVPDATHDRAVHWLRAQYLEAVAENPDVFRDYGGVSVDRLFDTYEYASHTVPFICLSDGRLTLASRDAVTGKYIPDERYVAVDCWNKPVRGAGIFDPVGSVFVGHLEAIAAKERASFVPDPAFARAVNLLKEQYFKVRGQVPGEFKEYAEAHSVDYRPERAVELLKRDYFEYPHGRDAHKFDDCVVEVCRKSSRWSPEGYTSTTVYIYPSATALFDSFPYSLVSLHFISHKDGGITMAKYDDAGRLVPDERYVPIMPE